MSLPPTCIPHSGQVTFQGGSKVPWFSPGHSVAHSLCPLSFHAYEISVKKGQTQGHLLSHVLWDHFGGITSQSAGLRLLTEVAVAPAGRQVPTFQAG